MGRGAIAKPEQKEGGWLTKRVVMLPKMGIRNLDE